MFRSLKSLEPSGIQLQGKQKPWEMKYPQTLKLRVHRSDMDAPASVLQRCHRRRPKEVQVTDRLEGSGSP